MSVNMMAASLRSSVSLLTDQRLKRSTPLEGVDNYFQIAESFVRRERGDDLFEARIAAERIEHWIEPDNARVN